jgi:hypothetical protein
MRVYMVFMSSWRGEWVLWQFDVVAMKNGYAGIWAYPVARELASTYPLA